MKMYEALDMNGMPIQNCPSAGSDVAVQVIQPTDERVKLWVVPAHEQEITVQIPIEGTGETITETYTEMIPASILYRGEDGQLHNMDSIAGAPGKDGVSPTVSLDDLYGDDGEKIGVKLTIVDKDSTKHASILDGAKGERGIGITSVDKTGTAGLVDTYTITFSDNSTTTFCITNAGSVEKTSQLENDSEFITNTVNNLVNYYTKEQTYTKEEIMEFLSTMSAGLSTDIVNELPDAATEEISLSTIYLVKVGESNVYTQYMWISGGWANLGTTAVNLENYYTKGEIDTKLGLYVSTTALLAILENYAKTANLAPVATSGDYNDLKNLPSIPSVEGLASVAYVDNKVQEAHNDSDLSQYRKKTDTIQYSEIGGTPTIDASLSNASTNALQNKAVYSALKDLIKYVDFTEPTVSWSKQALHTRIQHQYSVNIPSGYTPISYAITYQASSQNAIAEVFNNGGKLVVNHYALVATGSNSVTVRIACLKVM